MPLFVRGECFTQCSSTPSLAKAPAAKALLRYYSSAGCPSGARDPDPKLGSPLKTSWEQSSSPVGQSPAPSRGSRSRRHCWAGAGLPPLLGLSRGEAIHLSPSWQITPVATQCESAIQAEPWPCIIQSANPAEPWQLTPAPAARPASWKASPMSRSCGKGEAPSRGKEAKFYISPPPRKNDEHSCCHTCVYSSAAPAAPAASWGCQQKYPGGERPALLQCWWMGFRGERAQT